MPVVLNKQEQVTFRPGQSGNPKGRPKDALNRSRLRETIAKDLPDILKALASAAKGGDVQAAKLLLDRTLPALRPVEGAPPLALGTGSADLAGASAAVLEALASGRASVDQAASLAGVLSALARVKETVELEQRIAALEGHGHGLGAS
jgi:hypothetical protein